MTNLFRELYGALGKGVMLRLRRSWAISTVRQFSSYRVLNRLMPNRSQEQRLTGLSPTRKRQWDLVTRLLVSSIPYTPTEGIIAGEANPPTGSDFMISTVILGYPKAPQIEVKKGSPQERSSIEQDSHNNQTTCHPHSYKSHRRTFQSLSAGSHLA